MEKTFNLIQIAGHEVWSPGGGYGRVFAASTMVAVWGGTASEDLCWPYWGVTEDVEFKYIVTKIYRYTSRHSGSGRTAEGSFRHAAGGVFLGNVFR
jgi:hypothetical protein